MRRVYTSRVVEKATRFHNDDTDGKHSTKYNFSNNFNEHFV